MVPLAPKASNFPSPVQRILAVPQAQPSTSE
jgi:hypothetical protein